MTIFKKNNYKKHSNHAGFLLDQDSGLYVENYFHEMLSIERKRTERSKKAFVLMLINIQKLNQDEEVIKKIANALFLSTREIDIKGWYKYGRKIGVIFPEINGTGLELLESKIYKSLCDFLESEQIDKIKISAHKFPEKDDNHNSDNSADLTLYPDIKRKSKRISLVAKRIIDIAGSLACLSVLSPLFVVIPFLIKITSKGPVFFRQERLGEYGNRFIFLKFRTMQINNDPAIHQEYIKKFILEQKSYSSESEDDKQKGTFKIKDDPRVTSIGGFLRKTSLDELPQFLNVLKGEMSLVGPRPPIPYEIDNYDIWHKRRVIEIKPGITGLWQVMGRSSTTFDEMVRLDLQYIKNWSIWLDIKILFKTPWVVIVGKGAY